jgi:hypothetical protein
MLSLSSLWRISGIYLFLVGLVHTSFGLWLGVSVTTDMLSDGLINSGSVGGVIPQLIGVAFFDGMRQIEHVPALQRFGLFWFLFSGLAWMGFGFFLHRWIRETGKPPGKGLGGFFLAFGGLGAAIYPVSGF